MNKIHTKSLNELILKDQEESYPVQNKSVSSYWKWKISTMILHHVNIEMKLKWNQNKHFKKICYKFKMLQTTAFEISKLKIYFLTRKNRNE